MKFPADGKKMKKKLKGKKWSQAQDDAYEKKHNIKEGSKKDLALDKKHGITDNKPKKGKGKIKKSGSFGRAAQLKAKGVPRKANAAPGQKNYHGKK
jgi:hypothetical protein